MQKRVVVVRKGIGLQPHPQAGCCIGANIAKIK
jgi:hypothetical protein